MGRPYTTSFAQSTAYPAAVQASQGSEPVDLRRPPHGARRRARPSRRGCAPPDRQPGARGVDGVAAKPIRRCLTACGKHCSRSCRCRTPRRRCWRSCAVGQIIFAELGGDYRLEAFIVRLACFEGSDEEMESLAGMAVNKPPRDWVDLDIDRAAVELADPRSTLHPRRGLRPCQGPPGQTARDGGRGRRGRASGADPCRVSRGRPGSFRRCNRC